MIQTIPKLIDHCSFLLNNYQEASFAKNYLNSRISPDIQEKFKFGYFPDLSQINILFSEITEDDLKKSNLLIDNGIIKQLSFENHNLILPYRDVYGNIIAIVGRTLLSEEERSLQKIAKYKNTSFNKSSHLFGLFEAKLSVLEKDAIFIVEGQFDCIRCHSVGLLNTAALGSSNMTFDQLGLSLRYTNNIYLLLDNDDAGKNGSQKIIDKFSQYANIKSITLPIGFKDPDDYFTYNSKEDLMNLL